jgi:hypothetical protein
MDTARLMVLLVLLASLFNFRALAQSSSESFSWNACGTDVSIRIKSTDCSDRDAWDEVQPVQFTSSEIAVIAHKALLDSTKCRTADWTAQSVTLRRFGETHYWFYVVQFRETRSEIPQTITVAVRLNGDAFPLAVKK